MGGDLPDRMQALRARYGAGLARALAALETEWRCIEADPRGTDALRRFHVELHRLAGSGTTFGFAEISEVAQRLEPAVLAVLNDGAPLDARMRRAVRAGLDALHVAARAGAPPGEREPS